MFEYHKLFVLPIGDPELVDSARVIYNVIFVDADTIRDCYHVFFVSDSDADSYDVHVEDLSMYDYQLFLDSAEL